jgi:aminoimidazole riboside kinase
MPRPVPRVVAIGDAIVDLVTPPMPAVPAGDFQGEVSRFDALPGGNATNFALQMASLGARTTFIGCVGADRDGAFLRRAYRQRRVRAVLRTDPRRPTGATVALTWSDGRRALITSLGANAGLRRGDIPASAIQGADHVHRSGFWWTERLIGRPSAVLLSQARRAGATTSLDVSTDPRGWSKDRTDAVRLCLPFVDTFFGNEIEVCAIAGGSSPLDAARDLCSRGAGEVVLHQAERGSTGVTLGRVARVPALRVPIDNPTGCGDVFNAAYVHAKLCGASMPEALRLGNACAAAHLADRGRPYPSLARVRLLLRSASASA